MGLYPQSWVEEKRLDNLAGQFGATGSTQEEACEVKDGGEELKGEMLRGGLLQQVAKQLHGVHLYQLVKETGRVASHLKEKGKHLHSGK